MKVFKAIVALSASLAYLGAYAQPGTNPTPGDLIGADRAITTAVPFLLISPDSRRAALGDAGVASSPDANSAFWNAGQLVFIDKKYGGSLSYTPWLGKIVNDMQIAYLSGFYKIDQEQTIGASLKYFDLGEINFRDVNNLPLGDFNPREVAFDLTYSRKLTENFSVGLSGRFIHSNLTGAFSGADAQAGSSVSADVGVYYTKQLKSTRNSILSLGAQISNIGAKISYTDNANEDFIPTNLKFGGAYTTYVSPMNTFTFLLDFNKLMVPSVRKDQSLLGGMFGSFGDAPDGFSEELREFITNVGIEYWYNQTFAARAGYFLEAKDKGNRKYMTLGVGFKKNNFGIDVAYIVPTNQREHPLAETLRFSIMLQIPQTQLDKNDSVTD